MYRDSTNSGEKSSDSMSSIHAYPGEKPGLAVGSRHTFCGIAAIALLVACATEPPVSYRQDVYPLLESNCLGCHHPPEGEGYLKTGLSMENYRSLMQGTLYGPVIIPGDSRKSILNMLVEGRADAALRMPHEWQDPLTTREITILRLWVDQGAKNN
jgi:hypothetical protein